MNTNGVQILLEARMTGSHFVKSSNRYYFNNKFFIDNESQKLFEREKAFWNCYGAEWDKGNYNKEEDSKYCSAEADKIIK